MDTEDAAAAWERERVARRHLQNLVDGRKNHLHQLIAEAAFYQCVDCGVEIKATE